MDTDVILQRGIGFLDAHDVSGNQGYDLAAVKDVVQVVLQEFGHAVLEAFDLHVIGVGGLGEATGILDEVGQGLSIDEFVAHGALDGALDAHHLGGHGHKQDVVVQEIIVGTVGGVLHILVQVQSAGFAAAGQLDITHGTLSGGAAGCSQGVEHRVEGADGEAALYANLAVDIHGKGTGGADGYHNLVGPEGIVLGQLGADGLASLGQGEALEEDLGGAGGLDGAVGADSLVNLGLGRAEDGDVNLVAFAQDVGVGSLGTVCGAEDIQRLAGKEGVTVNAVTGGRGHVVLGQGFFQGFLGGSLTHGGLGKV